MKKCVVCGAKNPALFRDWSTRYCRPCHNRKARDVEAGQYLFALEAQEMVEAHWKPISPEFEARITDPGAWYKRTSMYIGSEK